MMFLYLLGMTLFGALGGVVLKMVSTKDALIGKLVVFMCGCLLYGLGAIVNVLALRHYPYTIIFPLSSLTYVWTFIISYFYLKEKINLFKLVGLLLIIGGAFIIAI